MEKVCFFHLLFSSFFLWKFADIAEKIRKIAKWEGPETPKGWPGTPKRRKKSLARRQEFVGPPNFWGLGASLSIIDTKKLRNLSLLRTEDLTRRWDGEFGRKFLWASEAHDESSMMVLDA